MTAVGETSRTPPRDHEMTKPHNDKGHGLTGELGFELPAPARPSKARLLALGVAGAVVLAAAFLASWIPRRRAAHELATAAKMSESVNMRVAVVAPKVKSSDHSLRLPGSVQALEETTVYARASGYVRKWLVDIGDHVEEGAVLVEIDTPELDQQLSQARAQLVQAQAGLTQAEANRDFAQTNLNRYKQLAPQGIASQQELDQSQAQANVNVANVKVAEAAILAQQANVHRLLDEKSFARVTAPFAGTVNARMIERGALVSPTTPLFKISAVDPVRVFVQVPQDVAPSVRPNVAAAVTVREYPGRTFQGTVARASGALDVGTRTMTTEVRVPNPKGELLAGMYAQVELTLPSPHRVLEVPATALLNDAKGLRVALVGDDSKIRLVPVTIERDTGPTIEIASGINEGDRVVKLANIELTDGKVVDVVQ